MVTTAGHGPAASPGDHISLTHMDMATIVIPDAHPLTGGAALFMQFRGSATRKPTGGCIQPGGQSPTAELKDIGLQDRFSAPMAAAGGPAG